MTAPDIREQVRALLNEHEVDASELGWSCKCGVYGAGDNYVDHLVDDVLGAAGLLRTLPDAYAVLSKRDGDGKYRLSGPWDTDATVFVDQLAADDAKVNWEVDLIECGRKPDVFVLAEIRVIP